MTDTKDAGRERDGLVGWATEVEKPEGYPFPDDKLIYCSAYDSFDPDANSYIAVARLPDEHELTVGGKKHDNTHRLVIHTPIRGPTAFLVNPQADGFDFLAAVMNILAEDSANGGWGAAGGYIPFVEKKAGVEWAFNSGDEKGETGDTEDTGSSREADDGR